MKENRPVLTALQRRVFNFVKHQRDKAGFVPTRREICLRFGWSSTNTAQNHLRALEKKGYVRLYREQRKIILVERK